MWPNFVSQRSLDHYSKVWAIVGPGVKKLLQTTTEPSRPGSVPTLPDMWFLICLHFLTLIVPFHVVCCTWGVISFVFWAHQSSLTSIQIHLVFIFAAYAFSLASLPTGQSGLGGGNLMQLSPEQLRRARRLACPCRPEVRTWRSVVWQHYQQSNFQWLCCIWANWNWMEQRENCSKWIAPDKANQSRIIV